MGILIHCLTIIFGKKVKFNNFGSYYSTISTYILGVRNWKKWIFLGQNSIVEDRDFFEVICHEIQLLSHNITSGSLFRNKKSKKTLTYILGVR